MIKLDYTGHSATARPSYLARLTSERLLGRFAYASEAPWPVRGVDLSYWNGVMRFDVLKEKVQFAFLRAGSGNDYIDPRLDTNRQGCEDNAIEYGLYWYAKASKSWQKHAAKFYKVWKVSPGKLPPVLDFESAGANKNDTTNWIEKLYKEFEQLSGVRVMFYTSPGWWNGNTYRNDWAKKHDLWNAHWTYASEPIIPHDWSAINNPVPWTMWQWSADGNGLGNEYGSIDGDKDMDLNRFNGSIPLFNSRYGTNIKPIGDPVPPPPPPPPIPGDTLMYVVQNSNPWLNVRVGPGTNYAKVDKLFNGDVVSLVDFDGDKVYSNTAWAQIGESAWVAKKYNGTQFLDLVIE